MQTVKLTGNGRKKGECRQGSILGTRRRRVDADREAYLEQEREGWMQTGKHTWSRKEKGGCRHGSIRRTGRRRVNANREAYLELEEEG
jgi:hypothetical protein